MTKEIEYKYYAFISYKREDEMWAKWLQNRLMHYRLPVNVRKTNPKLPTTIHPVFRDTTDLSGGVLAEAIDQALRDSRYLIVVCSPRAAQSPWVCKEVESFIASGREKYIIPFIVEGEPNAKNSAQECFPRALRDLADSRELLGININEMGRDAATIKVVAHMFGLQFDTLWRRWERDRRRRRWAIVLLSLLVAIIAIGVGIYIAQKNLELDSAIKRIDAINRELANTNEVLDSKNDALVDAIERLDIKNEELANANQELDTKNEELADANQELDTKNRELETANNQMQINNARYVSEKVLNLVNEGQSYTAAKLALDILPDNISSPNKPLLIESEIALRSATDYAVATLKGHAESVLSIAYSHDGKYIATGSYDNTIKIWDARTGGEVMTLPDNSNSSKIEPHTEGIRSVAFSPDGKLLASASIDRSVIIWNIEIKNPILKVELSSSIFSVAFSPDGEELAISVASGFVIQYDIESHQANMVYKQVDDDDARIPCDNLDCVRYSHNGKLMAHTPDDNTFRIWDVRSRSEQRSFGGHSAKVASVAFSRDGKYIASASADKTIKLWSVSSGEELRTFTGHTDAVTSIDFSPDGKYIVSASLDKSVRVWDITQETPYITLPGHTDKVNAIAFSPDGVHFATGSDDISTKIWALDEKLIASNDDYCGQVQQTAISHNNQYIATHTKQGDIHLFNATSLSSHNPIEAKVLSYDKVRSMMAISDNGKYVAMIPIWQHYQSKIINVDSGTKRSLNTMPGNHSLWATGADFTPDNKHIAISWSDGSVVLVASEGGTVTKRFDIDEKYRCNDHEYSGMGTLAISDDGKYIAAAATTSGNTVTYITLWDVESSEIIDTFEGHTSGINGLTFSPDGKYIASASSDKTVKLWDIENRCEKRSLIGHSAAIISVEFSSDCKHIVTASKDYTVRVWDTNSGKTLETYNNPNMGMSLAAFTNNNESVIAITADNRVRLWEFKPLQELIDETRERFKDNPLTSEERKEFYLE